MYRQNTPPTPLDPTEVARQAVKNCAMIQIGIAVLHVITLLLLVLQFSFYKAPADLRGLGRHQRVGTPQEEQGRPLLAYFD